METIKIVDGDLTYKGKYLKVPLMFGVSGVKELIKDVNLLLESYGKAGGYDITVESMPNYRTGAIYVIASKDGVFSGKVFFFKYYPCPENKKKTTWFDKDGILHISHT